MRVIHNEPLIVLHAASFKKATSSYIRNAHTNSLGIFGQMIFVNLDSNIVFILSSSNVRVYCIYVTTFCSYPFKNARLYTNMCTL